jgi:phosphatidylglycerophosphate synthase
MLDGVLRRAVDPTINALARPLARRMSAEQMTFLGLACGLCCSALIAFGRHALLSLLFLALCRFADGLDGAIARLRQPTSRGAFLDIVCDFIFYGSLPLAFAIADPATNALPAAVLLFAFYANGASFLAYTAIAAARGLQSDVRGPKGLYYTAGLMEGSETIAFFALMILFKDAFAVLTYAFAALCLLTALSRMALAWRVFGGR